MKLVARIDLVRLGAALKAEAIHLELVKTIDRAAAAGSIRDDLRSAGSSLKLICEIQERIIPPPAVGSRAEENTITGALFTQAVILYARATSTTGGRPKLLGEAKLTPDQHAVHREAIKLRDTTIAHFGRGEALAEGPIVKEAVILSLYKAPSGLKKQIGAYTTRAQHKVAFAARLGALIEIRLSEIDSRHQRLFDDADAALETALRNDPELGPRLPGFHFDVDAFCASPAAAAEIRKQLASNNMEDTIFAVEVPKP
jgi:hypothetical protein